MKILDIADRCGERKKEKRKISKKKETNVLKGREGEIERRR